MESDDLRSLRIVHESRPAELAPPRRAPTSALSPQCLSDWEFTVENIAAQFGDLNLSTRDPDVGLFTIWIISICKA